MLLEEFARRGHRVRAVSYISEADRRRAVSWPPRGSPIDVIRLTVTEYYLKVYQSSPTGSFDDDHPELARTLHRLVGSCRPDVVLVGRESFVRPVRGVLGGYDIPIVLRVAGGKLCGVFYGEYPRDEADRLLAELAGVDLLITPGRHFFVKLRAAGVRNVVHITNHVDLARFRPGPKDPGLLAEWNATGGTPVVLFAGNLLDRKKPEDFVLAAEKVARSNRDIRYVFLGSCGSRKIPALCGEKGLSKMFTFAGWVDYRDVHRCFQTADVVVSTSWAEGLARAYIEAQACGKVLVASDIPPAREVVKDGETGLLFPLGDTDALARRILEALEDRGLRARIAAAGRERVRHHDLEKITGRYINAFRQVVAGRRIDSDVVSMEPS